MRKHGYVAKGDIEMLVKLKSKYTAENANRRLRELAEEGIIEAKIIKNHVHYRYKQPTQYPTPENLAIAQQAIKDFESYQSA